MLPILFGCSSLTLTSAERAFFARENPFGFILFQRNCETPEQVRGLVAELREAVGRPDAPIFIDQEGGRVARLKPPHWRALPPLRRLGALFERDPQKGAEALRLHTRLIAHQLTQLGLSGTCAPVLDLFIDGASSAIGDRALSRDPLVVATLARLSVTEFLACGVLPVIKHIPGHGRVKVDPHEILPFVEAPRALLEAEDFIPFAALKDAPIAMNCHVVFRALDPENPVSQSSKIHSDIIRGLLGFEGLIFSDDLAMKALSAPLDVIAPRAFAAGADIVLYCPGTLPEMIQIAAAIPPMTPEAHARWGRAQNLLTPPKAGYDPAEDWIQLDILLQN